MLPMEVFSHFSCPKYSPDEEFLQLDNFNKLIRSEVDLNINITYLPSNAPVNEYKSFWTSELQGKIFYQCQTVIIVYANVREILKNVV